MLEDIISPVAAQLAMMEKIMASKSACGLSAIDGVMRHISAGGGKRMRPALFLLAARAIQNGGPPKSSEEMASIAAAIELVHTASLLHDDVVDESAERRGLPSANASFGIRTSVLAGDLLWCIASAIIVGTKNCRLIEALVEAARETTIGEMMEDSLDIDRDSYIKIIDGKTASLFAASGRAAAILAASDEPVEEALASYGRSLGIAFQLADDVADYPHEAAKSFARSGVDATGGTAAALALAHEYARAAKSRLAPLDSSAAKESLMQLADYAASRAQAVGHQTV